MNRNKLTKTLIITSGVLLAILSCINFLKGEVGWGCCYLVLVVWHIANHLTSTKIDQLQSVIDELEDK